MGLIDRSARPAAPLLAALALAGLAFAGLAAAADRSVQPLLAVGGDAGQGGPLLVALKDPEGLAFGPDGRLYVADRGRGRIFAIDLRSRIVEEIAGPEPTGSGSQTAVVNRCSMRGVQHVAVEPDGGILFAANDSPSLCRYEPRGRSFSIVAGRGGRDDFGGDGGPAVQAAIRVNGLACDGEGNILIAGANRIRRISKGIGAIQTVAGTGKLGFFGDGGPAVAADLARPSALAADRAALYFSDSANNRIRAVDRKGKIRTVAGNGHGGPPDDGDALRNATGEVRAVAVDGAGDVVFVNDVRRLRRLRIAQGVLETILETPYGPLEMPPEVFGLAVHQDGTIFFTLPKSSAVWSVPRAPGRRAP